jgi:hypothetical protein
MIGDGDIADMTEKERLARAFFLPVGNTTSQSVSGIGFVRVISLFPS